MRKAFLKDSEARGRRSEAVEKYIESLSAEIKTTTTTHERNNAKAFYERNDDDDARHSNRRSLRVIS